MAKRFKDLTEQEILALAISSEEDDARIYGDVAQRLRADFPATAEVFLEMQREESDHRRGLTELYRQRFGEHIPLIRRADVKGFVRRRPIWLVRQSSPGSAGRSSSCHRHRRRKSPSTGWWRWCARAARR